MDTPGSLYVAGAFTSLATIGPTDLVTRPSDCQDIYLAKYSPSGDLLWVKQGSGTSSNYADRLAALEDGTVLFAARLGFNGQFNGYTNLTSSNLFLRVSADGDLISAKEVPVAADGGLARDAAGNIYTLALGSPLKVTVAKYDAAGELLWLRDIISLTYSYFISPQGLVVGANGRVWLGVSYRGENVSFGSTNFVSTGSGEAYLARYDATGACEWAGRIKGSGGAWGATVAADKTGTVYWVGNFGTGMAFFGDFTLTNYGPWPAYVNDVFVVGLHSVLPRLDFALTSSGAQLSWPSWAEDFHLEQRNSPAGDAWTSPEVLPVKDGSGYNLVVPLTNTSCFFRLRHP